MRLVLINNYKDGKKQDVLRNLNRCTGQTLTMFDYDTPDLNGRVEGIDPDLVFLSGSSYLLTKPGTRKRFQAEIDLVRNASFPILGICFGHQLIGTAYGARMKDTGEMVRRFEEVQVLDSHPMFDGLPRSIHVAESHRQVLDRVPPGFVRLAESKTSHVEAMCHESKHIYTSQFHPERANVDRPHGERIIQNLLRLVKC